MNILINHAKTAFEYIKAFTKWFLISIVIGAVGGYVGSFFHLSIDKATQLREGFPWILYFLPLGGLFIAFIYRLSSRFGKLSTDRVLDALKTDNNVPAVMAPLIFVSTVITHFFGGSAGREGAALQLGGSMAYTVGKVMRLNSSDRHIIVMTGMSAVFAALFGTPLTAAIFSIEVTFVGMRCYAALLPCIISAIIGTKVALSFGLHAVRFDSDFVFTMNPENFGRISALAILCALMSIVFCIFIKQSSVCFKKLIANSYIRAFVGGVIIILLTLAVGCYDYNGAGMETITKAIDGSALPYAFILKLLFTCITIAAGFKGGEIVPAFFVGSTFGCVVGPMLGIDSGFAAQIGFVALFCGAVNCPIASLLLALEVFGSQNILVFAIVCAISYMMSGRVGLYTSQNILYSKISDNLLEFEVANSPKKKD